ncbi:histone deacetylase family protein [Henriciella sp. AS95]|uniref:histone deacetylase family protein n=1 Tax=Henriciella sp. AS95 TaxID=3135782 RepID=UPI00317B2B89
MDTFFDPRQTAHAPRQELQNGAFVPYAEKPERLDAILSVLPTPLAPTDHGDGPLRAVHTSAYLDFLQSISAQWKAEGRDGDALPYVFPVNAPMHEDFDRVEARLGRFCYDMGTPITPQSWESAYWSAQTALSALSHLSRGDDEHVFALCRPPGHHAGASYCGGYCFLNNAAISAQAALNAGADRVAILDVDYHHGNGTQDIFYERADVLVASLHADPRTDYPFYWGRADETGKARGAGTTLNLPLPQGTRIDAYMAALETALSTIEAFRADTLIVSFGADTYENDPISHFKFHMDDYSRLSAAISRLSIPTLIVMEGGYAVDAIGGIVSGFLDGFAS